VEVIVAELNTLYYGDNLDILRRYIADESVDLVYLDPPFNSNATYNVLFAEQNGTRAASQIKAFEDTWQWDQSAAHAYQEVVESGGKVSQAMQAFRTFLGDNDLLAYLCMMAPRLVELRRVLKSTGSIYLHCDATASHYLKMLMDSIFGVVNFQNEIIWRRYKRPKGSQYAAQRFGVSTDTLLFYSKSDQHKFFADSVKIRLDPDEIEKRYTRSDECGPYYSGPLLRSPSMGVRPNLVYKYKGFTPGPEGWRMTRKKLVALDAKGDIFWTDSGIPRRKVRPVGDPVSHIDNLWTDIEAIGSQATERLGYPTQKPEALLKRIIQVSSSEGNMVLDPFCGCGTAIAVAQQLNRKWIGIDITHLAITLMKHRLWDAFGKQAVYETVGEPVSLPDAQALAQADPYQFQWWALGLVGARPVEQKKGSDKGIDGRLYFHDEGESGKTKQVIFSVKAGNATVAHVRDLRGVIDREKAEIGVLISMDEPTKPMRSEAAGAGFYDSPWGTQHQRMQLLTIKDLLSGKRVDMPPSRDIRTFKKAPKAKTQPKEDQKGLWK
jgi:DNA modification methylase